MGSRTLTFRENPDGSFYIKTVSTLKNKEVVVRLGEAQDTESDDGRKINFVFALKDGNLFYTETWESKKGKMTSTHLWVMEGGNLHVQVDVNGKIATQKFESKA